MNDVENMVNSLMQYRNALGGNDQQIFDRLLHYAKGHVAACAKANNLSILESMLLAIVIEQQERIEDMQIHG